MDVEPNIKVVELGIEAPEVNVVDVLEYEGRSLALWEEGIVSVDRSAQESFLPRVRRGSPANLAQHRVVLQRSGHQQDFAES